MDRRKWAGVVGILVWLLAAQSLTLQAQTADWQAPAAELRFTVSLTRKPTPSETGYFIHIPDGGILPGKFPTPVVFAAEGISTGSELESYLLWHNRTTGAAVVFADPGPRVSQVHIYFTGGASPKVWTPQARLKPSAILCTEASSRSNLTSARDLGRFGAVTPTTHALNKSGIPIAPLSIGGDESGRPRPASFYLLSHVITTDPGKTWIAPFTIEGETLVLVNGSELRLENRIDKWGGIGAWFDLPKGLNRIEVFQTAPGTGAYGSDRRSGGLMYLTWRTPNATLEELGGARSNKVPMPGTSRMETRVLKFEEIARSGDGQVARVDAKNGAPVASIQVRPKQVFWLADEAPLIVAELQALAEGNPKDTTYTWDFQGGGSGSGTKIDWVFPGLLDHPIKLTARTAAQSSQCVTQYFAYATTATDLSDSASRADFRNALTGMVQAYPTTPDPVREWAPSIWNNLIRTLELGQGFDLLDNLVTHRRDALRKAVPPAQLHAIEDVFLDMLQQRDPKKALQLVETLGRESTGARLEQLLMRRFEIHLHYLNGRAEAEDGLKRLAEKASGEMKDWAIIRLGDVAFLAGDLNKAITHYGEVQRRAQAARNRTGDTPLDKLITEELLPEQSRSVPEVEKVPGEKMDGQERGGRKRKRDQAEPEAPPAEPTPPPVATEPGPAPGKWGVDALLDVNLSENVSTLIRTGFYLEAKEALKNWELKFPMSKISGDYILQEARYHMALQDWQRARSLLEAYCRAVDASSFLPEAARLLVACAKEMKTPPAEIRKVLETVKGNLQFHPVAKELEAYLSGTSAKG